MADDLVDSEGNVKKGTADDGWTSTSTSNYDAEKRKLEPDNRTNINANEVAGSKKQKVTLGFNKSFATTKEKKNPMPISIKLGGQKPKEPAPSLKKASASVAEMFNQDSDEEEMPASARMRMRNIGRDTPTSAGPNSFGKTRQGFCDIKKVFERQLKKQMDDVQEK